jgi:zinc-ribbon domain
MRVETETKTLFLSDKELTAISRYCNCRENTLSLIPAVQPSSSEKAKAVMEFQNLEESNRLLYSGAIATLAQPAQTGKFHYSIADQALSQLFLAWSSEDQESVASLARTGETLALRKTSVSEVKTLLTQVVALDTAVPSTKISLTLSAAATLVFMAIMDYYRKEWYHSLLNHSVPNRIFSVVDVLERIYDTSSEDFRWPLIFFDKVLPMSISSSFTEEEVFSALKELTDIGLLMRDEAEEGEQGLALYALTVAGDLITDGFLHDISKAGLSVSALVDNGQIGYEALLFLRDTNYLWLIDISGNRGAIANINNTSFDALLLKIMVPPKTLPTKPSQPGSTLCAQCGSEAGPEDRFCSNCGAKMREEK